MLITIYDSTGTPKAELSPNDSSTQVKEIQGDSVLTLSFTHYDHISLDVDDYVDFEGERFWLTEKYRPRQNSRKEWVYDIKLYGVESMLKRFLVIKTVDDEDDPVFTLTAPPHEHVAMIVKCMNNGLGNITDWKVGQVDGTENIVIDYFGKYCDEALKEIAEKVGAEAWVEGQTVNICKCEHGEPIPMGYDKGLLSIDPGTADNVKFYTRLYPVGSSRNIDREKYGYSRLQLPGGQKYVEINADKYGRVDHYEADAFADIYPRRTGIVSNVRSEVKTGEDGNPFTIYYFSDDSLPFDPNDYEIGGLVKRVSFQEGSELAGLGEEDNGTYYFEVNFNSSTREFEIITIWPYDDDMQLPGDKLIPKIGDKYILWNLRMPDEYYELAEAEFMSAVNKYNADHNLDISVYKAPTDHVWIEDNEVVLTIGQRIRLESNEYFPETGYRDSRITKITRKVNLPSSMDIEISDALSRTSQAKMIDSIEEVRSYAKSIGESTNLPDIIRSWDNTLPTDNNLFSARRSLREFLNKNAKDTAKEIITFEKGIEVGEYEPGAAGGILGMDADGDSFAEVARLYVRVKAFFEELTVVKSSVLAGKQYITPGGGIKCVKVEETDTAYRCYFLSEQEGEKTQTKFIVDDQAISEVFNAAPGTSNKVSNHRYWRLVTSVNNDAYTDENTGNHYGYIELSKTNCEAASDIPAVGDEICQLGYQGNDNRKRQTAIVFSTVDADAPSVKMYSGINSYSLAGKAIISFGCDPLTGQIFFRLGNSSAKKYLEYTQEGGLEVVGRISSLSTYDDGSGDDKTLGEVMSDRITDTDVLYISHGSQTVAPALPVLGADGRITDYKGWTTDAPTWSPGEYIWQTMYTLNGNGEGEFTGTICVPVRNGVDGASAKVVVVNADAQAFVYENDFATLVGPSSINLSASLQGTTGYQWSYKRAGKSSFTNLPDVNNGKQPNIAIGHSGLVMGTTVKSVTIRCTSGDVYDEVTIIKVSSGSNGVDGENGANYAPNLLKGTDDETWINSSVSQNSGQAGEYNYVLSDLGLAPGDTITLSLDVKTSSGKSLVARISYYNASGVNFDNAYGTNKVVNGTDRIWVTGTIPANAVSIHLRIANRPETITTTTTEQYKGLKLCKGEDTTWSPAASEMIGEDGYSIILTNESHIFKGDTTKAVAASTTCDIIAYKGAEVVAANIGSITGMPTGMTVAISNNGTKSAMFTVSVTTALTTKQGTLNVPITVDGKTFNRTFSWSLSLDGRGIKSVVEEYAIHTSGSTAPLDTEFSTGIKTMTDAKPYLWNREKTTYTDDTTKTTDAICIGVKGQNGDAGAIVVSVTNYYLASASASGVTTSTAGWVTSPTAAGAQISADKPYLWNYEVTKWSKGSDTSTAPHIIGTYGSNYTNNLLLKTENASLTYTTANVQREFKNAIDLKELAGKTITISFDYEYTNVVTGATAQTRRMGCEWAVSSASGTKYPSGWLTLPASDSGLSGKGRFVTKSTIPSDVTGSMLTTKFYIQLSSGSARIWNFKIEEGVNPNPVWTPNSLETVTPTITEQYCKHTSNTTPPTSGWQDTNPGWTAGYYIWTRTKVEYATGEVTYTDPVCGTGESGSSYANNLLPGTQNWDGWSTSGYTKQEEKFNDLTVYYGSSPTASYIDIQCHKVDLEGETVYTLSVWAKGSGAFDTFVYPDVTARILSIDGVASNAAQSDTRSRHTLTAQWKRYYVVFRTVNANLKNKNIIACRIYKDPSTQVWVAGAKLEKGENHNPQWSLAPSEMAAVIYSIEPSIDYIVKNALNALSATTFTVTKYKTTGNTAREATTDKVLKYQRVGIDSGEITLSNNGGAADSTISGITAACSRIILKLYDTDGSTLLNNKTVPVLADASDYIPAGQNLVLNSGFTQGANNWSLPACATIDKSRMFQGSYAVKVDSKGNSTNVWNGISQTVGQNPALDNPEVGEYYAFSIWVYYEAPTSTNGVTNLDAGASLEFAWRDTTGVDRNYAVSIVPTATGQWQRFSIIRECQAGTKSLRCRAYVVKNGTMWFAAPMITKGSLLADWAPSPRDTNYLQKALQEVGSIEGGLALLSLIKLGATNATGLYKVMAGLNGIFKSDNSPVIWGGGDATEGEDDVTMLFRMDGTGFLAGKVIKFYKDRITIGDDIILNEQGLSLRDSSGNIRVRITNESVGNDLDLSKGAEDLFPKNIVNTTNIKRIPMYNDSNSYTFYQQNDETPLTVLNQSLGNLSENTTIALNIPVSMPFSESSPDAKFHGSVYVNIYKAGTANPVAQTSADFVKTGSTTYTANVTFSFAVKTSGTYTVKAELAPSAGGDSGGTQKSSNVTIPKNSIKVITGFPVETLVGCDGVRSTWGTAGLLTNASGTLISAGSYGMRILTASAPKINRGDGNGWVNI